jgi:hypothetical protein
MPQRPSPPGQLDIPLIWESSGEKPGTDGPEGPHPPAPQPPGRAGFWRLWLAVLADGGMVVLAVTGVWGMAAAFGVGLVSAQLVLASGVGLEVATVVALGCLWGWRASPGMLLAGVCFSQPIPFARAWRLWLCWLVSLPVLGVPLLVRRRGEGVAERLAGGTLSFRSLPEDA